MGIEQSGLDQLIRAAYDLLGLATYFTVVNKKFVRGRSVRESRHLKQLGLSTVTLNEASFVRKQFLMKT